VQAPEGDGARLIPRTFDAPGKSEKAGDDTEIRLTYRELSALIEDALRNLR
jgi:hypothetical protein